MMMIIFSGVNAITSTMDMSTVMTTQDHVASKYNKHAKSCIFPDARSTLKEFIRLSSSISSISETLDATLKAVKNHHGGDQS